LGGGLNLKLNVKALKANIWKLNTLQALCWFMLTMPTIVLFFQSNGLSMTEILLLQSIFSLTIVATEIPSGYFSDKIGRRKTIIIATIISFISFFLYCFASNFWSLVVVELLMGVGISFISGTDSALMYDTLLELNQQDQYKKTQVVCRLSGIFLKPLRELSVERWH